MRFFGVVTDAALASMDPAMPTSAAGRVGPVHRAGRLRHCGLRHDHGGTDANHRRDRLDSRTRWSPARQNRSSPLLARGRRRPTTDIRTVFGEEDDRHFWIGSPLDMETRLYLNIEEMVKRSNGVFGKSGTGKTFLTRLLLAGILQKDAASNLVFDMHNEYGWQGYVGGGDQHGQGPEAAIPLEGRRIQP